MHCLVGELNEKAVTGRSWHISIRRHRQGSRLRGVFLDGCELGAPWALTRLYYSGRSLRAAIRVRHVQSSAICLYYMLNHVISFDTVRLLVCS